MTHEILSPGEEYANWKAPETGKEQAEQKESPEEEYIRARVEETPASDEEVRKRQIAIIKIAQDLLNRYRIGVEADEEYLDSLIQIATVRVLLPHGAREYQPWKNYKTATEEGHRIKKELEDEESELLKEAIEELYKRKGLTKAP